MQTLGGQLDMHRGIGPGFDFLRIFLAFAIVAWHSRDVVSRSGTLSPTTGLWFIEYSLLPVFFALSGFLVAGSGMRLSLGNFLINRGLRILPALALEILFSAFILGAIFTKLPLGEYFTSPGVYHYLTNMVGVVNFYLPGVFTDHPWTMVNGALWTVPYEMICYALLSVLIVMRWLHSRSALLACTAVLLGVGLALQSIPGFESTFDHGGDTLPDKVVRFFFTGEQSRLLGSFLMGAVFYSYRDRIAYNAGLFAVSAAVCVAVAVGGDKSLMADASLRIVTIPALTYMMAFVGVTRVPLVWPLTKGDYSYGIYLYHLPFQQVIWALFPTIDPLRLFLVSVPVCTVVAAASWHVVEKPVLRMRKRFNFVARVRDAVPSVAVAREA